MKRASEFIKLSASFTHLLYSFSVITVTPKPKKPQKILKMIYAERKFDLPIWQKGLLVAEINLHYVKFRDLLLKYQLSH